MSRRPIPAALLFLTASTLGACHPDPVAAAPQVATVLVPGPSPIADTPPAHAPPPDPLPCPVDPPDREVKPPDNDGYTYVMPSRDVPAGRVVCKAGAGIWRDAAGHLRVCTVARRVTLDGIDVAAGAYSLFHENGHPYQTHVARPQALATAAGQVIPCGVDLVVLSDTGVLESCKLGRPLAIGGVPCRAGESVAFHPGGQLAAAVVDSPIQALGATFPAGTRLQWHPTGAFAGGWLAEPLEVLGYRLRWELTVHQNGKLASFELQEALTLQGHALPEGTRVALREDGSLRRADYVSQRGFMPHGEEWHDTTHLRFDCHANLLATSVEHWQSTVRPPKFR